MSKQYPSPPPILVEIVKNNFTNCAFKAFLLFDLNGDGCIDEEDLRATFGTLGDDNIPEGLVEQMMSEV